MVVPPASAAEPTDTGHDERGGSDINAFNAFNSANCTAAAKELLGAGTQSHQGWQLHLLVAPDADQSQSPSERPRTHKAR